MTTFTVLSIIAIALIGLILIAELVALTVLFMRVSGLVQQVRDHVDPVVDQSTQLMRKVNDVTDTVKGDVQRVADTVTTDVKRVADSVTGVTTSIATRADRTSASVQRATNTALAQFTSPPVLTAIALFAGMRLASPLQRLLSWPVVSVLTLLAAVPSGLRAWRAFQDMRAAPAGAVVETPLTLRPTMDTMDMESRPQAA